MNQQGYACSLSEEWKALIILMPVSLMDTGTNCDVFLSVLFKSLQNCLFNYVENIKI